MPQPPSQNITNFKHLKLIVSNGKILVPNLPISKETALLKLNRRAEQINKFAERVESIESDPWSISLLYYLTLGRELSVVMEEVRALGLIVHKWTKENLIISHETITKAIHVSNNQDSIYQENRLFSHFSFNRNSKVQNTLQRTKAKLKKLRGEKGFETIHDILKFNLIIDEWIRKHRKEIKEKDKPKESLDTGINRQLLELKNHIEETIIFLNTNKISTHSKMSSVEHIIEMAESIKLYIHRY